MNNAFIDMALAPRRLAGLVKRRLQHRWRQIMATDTTHGELAVIRSVLPLRPPDMIVEVGANDPFHGSMSWPFIHRGWKAVLIEPHPVAFARLRREYEKDPRVTLINAACSNEDGILPLTIGTDGDWGTLSTLCQDDDPILNQRRTEKEIMVKVHRLHDLLAQRSVPRNFKVLSVDTEGMDYEVLLGLDLSIFRPQVIVTEDYARKDAAKYALLQNAGYELLGKCDCNSLWRAKS